MKALLLRAAAAAYRFLSIKPFRRLSYIAVLFLIALTGYAVSGMDRRTLVFFNMRSGSPAVEERLVPRDAALESALARYVEEVLLGPSSVDEVPLFTKGSRLISVLARDDSAYIDLSEIAALPVPGGVPVRQSLDVLRKGILRNFPAFKDVRIFIAGNEPYAENFDAMTQDGNEKK